MRDAPVRTKTANAQIGPTDLRRSHTAPRPTRLPTGIAATEAAHELARAAAPHLDALEAALEALTTSPRAAAGPLAGAVLVGGPAELMGARVVPALASLREQGVTVRARLGLPEALIADLAAGALDLVVATQRVARRDVEYDALYNEEFVLVAAPAWACRLMPGSGAGAEAGDPAALAPAALAAVLAGAPLVAYAADLPILQRYWRAVFGARLSARAAVIVPDLRAVIAAVVAGAGVSVVPRYLAADALAADALAAGDLVALHAPARPPRNRLWLARRAGPTGARVGFTHALLLRTAEGR